MLACGVFPIEWIHCWYNNCPLRYWIKSACILICLQHSSKFIWQALLQWRINSNYSIYFSRCRPKQLYLRCSKNVVQLLYQLADQDNKASHHRYSKRRWTSSKQFLHKQITAMLFLRGSLGKVVWYIPFSTVNNPNTTLFTANLSTLNRTCNNHAW